MLLADRLRGLCCWLNVVAPSPSSSEFLPPGFGGNRRLHEDGAGLGGIIGSNVPPGGAAMGGPVWSCQHCTYHNAPHQQACEICGLPRQ